MFHAKGAEDPTEGDPEPGTETETAVVPRGPLLAGCRGAPYVSRVRRLLLPSLLCLPITLTPVALAETLRLKEGAAISGRIVSEKPETVFVDVGYTVVGVPRGQVLEIVRDTAPAPPADSPPARTDSPADALPAGMFGEASPDTREAPVRELVGRLGEAVVQVRTPGGLGSGFFIHPDGYFVTNFHVIEGETKISVEVYHQKDGQLERRSYKDVRIVAMNKFADLALLKVEDKEAPRFKTVPLGFSDGLAQGDRVFAIGSPLGLERTVTEGIVSTTAREVGGDLYLQTTAQINPGNSGGPLFNSKGSVVGVTNMKLTFGEGLGFAIPVAVLRYFLDHRDAYAYDNDNPSNAFRYLEPPSRLKLPLRGAATPQ